MKHSSHEHRFLFVRTPEKLPERGREHLQEQAPELSPLESARNQFNGLKDNVRTMLRALPFDEETRAEQIIQQTETAANDVVGRALNDIAGIERSDAA